MIGFTFTKRCVFFAANIALAVCLAPPILAQSLDVKNPAVLRDGVNRGTIDSFGGEQFWTFTAQPGNFQLIFSHGSPQEGFQIGPKVGVGAVFAPKTAGATLSSKDSATGTVFDGHVNTPTRVVIMIEPAKSPLVRQTNDYTLEARGAVGTASSSAGPATTDPSGGQAGPAPSVVGVYNIKLNDTGAAKFQADGTIVTTSGNKGSWECFDADTRTYVIVLGGNRYTLTHQPARGFVDNNGVLVLELKH